MKKLTLIITVIFLCIALIMPADAKMKKLAQTGMKFLDMDVVPRAIAMGGSYMMVGDDATALFYNPAGIAYTGNSIDFFASQTQWVANISYTAGGLLKNLGNLGTFGVSMIYCDYGDDIQGTRITSTEKGYEKTEMIDVGAWAVGVAYGRRLTNKFSVGGQIHYATQKLGTSVISEGTPAKENKVDGITYDFGTIFYPGFKSLRVGMSIRNYSADFEYEEETFQAPLTFTIGAAMDVMDFLGEHENALLLSIDALHPRDYTERLNIGAEFLLMDIIAIRAGYRSNYDEEGLTLGAGLNYSLSGLSVKFDYAYSPMTSFDVVNRFSIGIGL
ncbi:PorV/PorQ family protein [bacterium]|nr:PorV/PorQ family protein [bacterium]